MVLVWHQAITSANENPVCWQVIYCYQYFNSNEQYQKAYAIQLKERFKLNKPYIKYDIFCLDKKENGIFRPSKVNHDADRYYWIKMTTDSYRENVIFCLFLTYIFFTENM